MSGSNTALAGIASAAINGTAYNVVSHSWRTARFKRETMTSQSGVDGFSKKYEAGFIALKLRDAKYVNVSALNALEGATVVLQLTNGKQISGTALWGVTPEEVDGAEATFDVRFEGTDIIEVGAPAS